MSQLRILLLAMMFLSVVAACYEEKEPPTVPSVITITFTPSTPVVHVGETLHLDVDVKGAPVKSLIWSSNDQTVAAVDALGNVKGVNPGQTLVTVRFGQNSSTMGAVLVAVQ
jgi:uncharacterized protein YjdB